MPTTYSHDLFGKLVFARMPIHLQQIVMKYKRAYLIGLHGPDIFFYNRPFQKNPVNQLGNQIHEESARVFFERSRRIYLESCENKKEAAAYLLGYVCHFMLDSTCHPYIEEVIADTRVSHAEIESELDRALMQKNGKDPFTYRPASVISKGWEGADTISCFYEDISRKMICRLIGQMHFYTSVTVCRSSLKRHFLLAAMKVLGCYESMEGQVIRRQPNERIGEQVARLEEMFHLAVPETVCMIERYYSFLVSQEELPARFDRNFL